MEIEKSKDREGEYLGSGCLILGLNLNTPFEIDNDTGNGVRIEVNQRENKPVTVPDNKGSKKGEQDRNQFVNTVARSVDRDSVNRPEPRVTQ